MIQSFWLDAALVRCYSGLYSDSNFLQHLLLTKAKTQKMTIALPEGVDWHVVVAASELVERDLCNVVILGEPEKVNRAK